jgi:hypothetical protein
MRSSKDNHAAARVWAVGTVGQDDGYEPSQILHRLARVAAENPGLGFVKPHFFSFGGAAKNASLVR